MYYRYLRRQWREIPDVSPFPVLIDILVHALAVQVIPEVGNVDQDILEMVDLCEARLDSDISIESLISAIFTFVGTILRLERPFERQTLQEEVIGYLRKAHMRLTYQNFTQRLSHSHDISVIATV